MIWWHKTTLSKSFIIQTDRDIEATKQDITVLEKKITTKNCLRIEVALSGEQNIKVKEFEKMNKYIDFPNKNARMSKIINLVLIRFCWLENSFFMTSTQMQVT